MGGPPHTLEKPIQCAKKPPEMIEDIEQAIVGKPRDDPAVIIYFANDASIHACLQCPSPPVPVGATPAISATNLKRWLFISWDCSP